MPTLLMDKDNQIIIDQRSLNLKHVAAADWVFEYDPMQLPAESSRRKRVFGGTYIEPESVLADGVPARAVEFAPEYLEGFGRECASLAKANAVGVGPRVLQIHKCPPLDGSKYAGAEQLRCANCGEAIDLDGVGSRAPQFDDFRAVVIEEDVGVNLAAAIEEGAKIPGPLPAPLHPSGTPERERENAKIKFDVFSQLHNLHSNGMFHRDLRVANVCVRRHGENPEDIRATLIDFELISDVSKSRLEASAREYLDAIFQGKTFLLPIEVDMGYLAAFCYELETGHPVREAGPEFFSGTMYPFFRLSGGTAYIRRITQADLDALAAEAGLVPVDEGGIARLTGERLGVADIVSCVSSLVNHGGYLDAKDVALLKDDPEFIILSNRERIALESFETYKAQIRSQGGVPDYEDFFAQPEKTIQTALDNIAKYRAKAERFGYRIVHVKALRDRDVAIQEFSVEEMEQLAKMEHDRWMAQKISQGYVWGEAKDDEKKTHPCIVPYDALPENEKDKDRRNIRNMIPFLREVGLVICR